MKKRCFVELFIILLVTISLASALPEIPDVGPSGCVEESGTCGPETTPVSPELTGMLEQWKNDKMKVISDNREAVLEAIRSCEINVRDCAATCGGMPNSQYDEKTSCYHDCSFDVLDDHQAYEKCVGSIFKDYYVLYDLIGDFKNQCPPYYDFTPCLDKCTPLDADHIFGCINDCGFMKSAEDSKTDICESQAYSKTEQYLSNLIAGLPPKEEVKPVESGSASVDISQTLTSGEEGGSDEGKEQTLRKNVYKVGDFRGDIQILSPDGTIMPLIKGMQIKEGDKIITGNNGNILMDLVDGSGIVEIKSNTQFEAGNLEKESFLNYGRVKAFINKLMMRRFVIRTITAVAAVRGTEFVVSADQATGNTEVYLNEGVVDVTNLATNVSVQLNSGEKVFVEGQAALQPVIMADDEWKSVNDSGDAGNPGVWFLWLLIAIILAFACWIYFRPKSWLTKAITPYLDKKGFTEKESILIWLGILAILTIFLLFIIIGWLFIGWLIFIGGMVTILLIERNMLIKQGKLPKKSEKQAGHKKISSNRSLSSSSSNSFGIASLVLGILGILLFFIPLFGMIFSILAIIFYFIQKKKNLTGLATAGLVLGIIGSVLGLILIIVYINILSNMPQIQTTKNLPINEFSNAVIIQAANEKEGSSKENTYLYSNACLGKGGVKIIGMQTLQEYASHKYDIISVTCNDLTAENHYFMIDSFFGKR
jgi:hypothetical protein